MIIIKRTISFVLAFVFVGWMCAFTPSESDLEGLSDLQKEFVSASDWSSIAETVLTTMKEGIKHNVSRAQVISGCIYDDMPRPEWLRGFTSKQSLERRMYANAVLADAFNRQILARDGKDYLNKPFLHLIEGVKAKIFDVLNADDKQASKIEDLVARHLVDALHK